MPEKQRSPLETFEELAAQTPDSVIIRYSLGREYMKAHRYADAEQQFREAIRLKPDYSAAYRELGKTLTGLQRFDEAKEVYRKGIDTALVKGDLQTKKEIEVFYHRLENRDAADKPDA